MDNLSKIYKVLFRIPFTLYFITLVKLNTYNNTTKKYIIFARKVWDADKGDYK